ncbi:MAG: DUF4926 domain-containing protein [Cyanobacteria bacterium J06631_12]
MKLALYQEIALNRDFPDRNLRKGDVATLIDYVPHPGEGEEGVILEVFDALGDTVAVLTVPVSSVDTLQSGDVLAIRRLS